MHYTHSKFNTCLPAGRFNIIRVHHRVPEVILYTTLLSLRYITGYMRTKTLLLKQGILLFLFLFITKADAQVSISATGGTTSAAYTTLSDALTAINNGMHNGDILVYIHTDFTEPAACSLNASGNGAA